MPNKLPVLSGDEVIRALERGGFVRLRQKGSHVVMTHPDHPSRRTVVPLHKELDRGLLRGIISQCGLSVQEFNDLLN
ncbi:MAG: type II toxin-antitoxin system HicA family toxin [Phycisphaerales bacterium]